ncbi:serine/threonine-protein kinase Sgk1-like [Contarinia nasturtii]|uniref:serine/threonine-protein kinase Sgk1-like n=1 Tax=Contarinia nasturtii TaxID=265458 RepID=UPI0012D376FB|nr:serine/threonine-protein kinase Sgk1-like [Contarinia nasturtii]
MPRHYVDNAMNRSLGRVGMAHGTAVHSTSSYSSSSSSPSVYVDNSMNRSLGRVGLEHGTAVHSRSSYSPDTSSSRVYVDNSMNQRLGRVGLPIGSAVHSSSSQSSYATPSKYVDNELNRQLGRVGLEKGTAVHSKSEKTIRCAPRTYVDNAYNRKLGRVGQPLGLAVDSKSKTTVGSATSKTYVDNALNRRLGRVGKPLGSCVASKLKCDPKLFDFNANVYKYQNNDFAEIFETYPEYVCEEIENLNNLKQARRDVIAKKDMNIELKREQIIAFDDLDLGEKIGGGGFGDVHIALWKNQQVAVKKLRVQRVHQAKKKQFEDEVRGFTNLDHPYIVKFYGACIVPPNLAIVMELLLEGSLYDNLYYSEEEFNDATKNQFICDFFLALQYIHSKNMVHRDIKSKNIMLSDGRKHCKLADFGLALKDDTESNASTKQFGFAGTEKYCPKEVIQGKRLTIDELKSVDVYALALTSFELLTEEEPFSECRNIHEIRRAICYGDILKTVANKDCGISAAKKDLLKSALSQNRPTAADFLKKFNQIIAAE